MLRGRARIAEKPEIPVIAGSQALTSITVVIKTKTASYNQLMDPNFCAKEAKRMFEWFQQNLPHGVYQELYRLMKERQDFLEEK